jgi:hypothetical protein
MLEKLLLAIGLTFALSLFAELTLPSSQQAVQEPNLQNHTALVVSQWHQ